MLKNLVGQDWLRKLPTGGLCCWIKALLIEALNWAIQQWTTHTEGLSTNTRARTTVYSGCHCNVGSWSESQNSSSIRSFASSMMSSSSSKEIFLRSQEITLVLERSLGLHVRIRGTCRIPRHRHHCFPWSWGILKAFRRRCHLQQISRVRLRQTN